MGTPDDPTKCEEERDLTPVYILCAAIVGASSRSFLTPKSAARYAMEVAQEISRLIDEIHEKEGRGERDERDPHEIL